MKHIIMSFSFLLPFCATIAAMEDSFLCQQATKEQIPSIVTIINDYAAKENNKIVVLPKLFREKNVTDAIANTRLYCASDPNTQKVVAFKKFFIINDKTEYKDIILNEIRCSGEKSVFKKATSFDPQNKADALYFDVNIPWSFENSIIFYTGSDYTVPTYRGKKINSLLMEHAFESSRDTVKQTISHKKVANIVFLYGLTRFNAGEDNGIDRTPSIVRAFRKFTNKIFTTNTNNIIHKSYSAFMPTFDLSGTECKPLPDNKSIPGYGNVLIFPLDSTKTETI